MNVMHVKSQASKGVLTKCKRSGPSHVGASLPVFSHTTSCWLYTFLAIKNKKGAKTCLLHVGTGTMEHKRTDLNTEPRAPNPSRDHHNTNTTARGRCTGKKNHGLAGNRTPDHSHAKGVLYH